MNGILSAQIRLYGADGLPKYKCVLNENNKYDIFHVKKDWSSRYKKNGKAVAIKTDVSSADIQKKIKPACFGCIYC